VIIVLPFFTKNTLSDNKVPEEKCKIDKIEMNSKDKNNLIFIESLKYPFSNHFNNNKVVINKFKTCLTPNSISLRS